MRFFLFIAFILIGVLPAFTQNIVVDGRTSNQDTKKREGGVTVTVMANGNQIAQTTSASNGNYSLSFPIAKSFRVVYSKPGFQSKFIEVNTSGLNEEDMPIGGKIFRPIDIELFAVRPNANLGFMDNEPVVKWKYESQMYAMDWDKGQAESMRNRITAELERAEKELKASEGQYSELIKAADALFVAENYEDALNKYSEALMLPGKAAEEHPTKRLLEIDALLKKKAKEELANKQANQAYFDAIAEADKLKADKKLDQAEAKYKEAKSLKPDEDYPDKMLLEIQLIRNAAENRAEYEKMIEQADKFLKQNSLQAARDKYKKASQLDPSEEYPKQKLQEIEDKLKEQEEIKEKKRKYDEAIELADKLYDQGKYEEAKAKYEEATQHEPAASYPVERIKMADEKIQELADAAAKEQEFQDLVKAGNEALNSSEYDEAIEKFEAALKIKPADAGATKQLESAKELKAKMANQEAKAAKINELLLKADQEIAEENFEAALETLSGVFALDAGNTDAATKKKTAEEGIKAKNQKADLLAKFEGIKQDADNLYVAEKYSEAKAKYEEANKLIADDAHVLARIQSCAEKIEQNAAQKALNEQIAKLIESAEKAEGKNNFDLAIQNLEEALGLDESRGDVKDKLEAVRIKRQAVEDADAQTAKFNDLKQEADNLFGNKEWTQAKEKYLEAKEYGSDPKIEKNLETIAKELEKLSTEQEREELYASAIQKAQNFEMANKLTEAIEAYNEALQHKEKDPEATSKIKELQNLIEQREKDNQIEQEFAKLKESGDQLFAQKKWNEAKSVYKDALKKKDDAGIDANLQVIEQELAKLTSATEKEEQYKKLIAEAEKQESADKLEAAVELYKEALNVKDGDAHATTKINELESIIEGRIRSSEKDVLYNAALKEGKEALTAKDYPRAIELFDDALEVKPMDPEAMKLKEQAKNALDELSKNEAAYQTLLVEANKQFDAGNLLVAKDIYRQAQGLRPQDPLPQTKIVEIDELLRKKQEEEEANQDLANRNKKYQDKLDLADMAAGSFKYDKAIEHLKEAAKIKPEEDYPVKKIKEYQALLDQLAAASSIEQQYKDAIRKADQAFDNQDFDRSIELYNAAIEIKNEDYPKEQITKAKKAKESLAANEKNRKYQDYIEKANNFFVNENYEQAIVEYKNALGVIEDDAYALGRIKESEQYLSNIADAQSKMEKDKQAFDQLIAEADKFFDNTEFIKSKDKYEEALKIYPTNPYAIKRVEEAISKAQEKARSGDEAAYRKIIDKADEYFDDENYDKARNLYERAIKLRSFDQYPKDQLDEIERRLRAPVKVDASLEYLGEEVDISILEGQALFAKAELQREQDKKQGVLKRIFANEKNFEEKTLDDLQERLAYQNEIMLIKDRRNELVVANNQEQQKLAVNIDDEMYSMTALRRKEINFERGSVLQQNEKIVYMLQDYDGIHEENRYKHLEIAEQLDVLVQDQEVKIRSIAALKREQVLGVNDYITEQLVTIENIHAENSDKHLINADKLDDIQRENEMNLRASNALKQDQIYGVNEYIIDISDDLNADVYRATELRQANEDVVRNIDMNMEAKIAIDAAENYEKIQGLQRDATLAEIAKHESATEKAIIQLQLEEDIRILVGQQQLKSIEEMGQLRSNTLEMDQLLVRASEQFKETTANSDEARKVNVEVVKSINAGRDAKTIEANNKKYEGIQENVASIETTRIKNEEQHRLMEDELLAINEEIKSVQQLLEREHRSNEVDELNRREKTMDALQLAKIEGERIHSEKAQTPAENSEAVKGIEMTLDRGHQARENEFKNRKQETNKLLEGITNKKIVMTENIANALGDEFPEGVTQQTFMNKDQDGYPQKITTRRIVVTEGKGEVYLRVETRNAVTYSKNGEPITEAAWYTGTENSKLTRHF